MYFIFLGPHHQGRLYIQVENASKTRDLDLARGTAYFALLPVPVVSPPLFNYTKRCETVGSAEEDDRANPAGGKLTRANRITRSSSPYYTRNPTGTAAAAAAAAGSTAPPKVKEDVLIDISGEDEEKIRPAVVPRPMYSPISPPQTELQEELKTDLVVPWRRCRQDRQLDGGFAAARA